MSLSHILLPPTPLLRRFHRSLIAETIGTFMLVIAITLASLNAGDNAPIAIGFMLLTQVFSYGYISGGMFNPSVTAGISLVRYKRGEDGRRVLNGCLQYFLVQVLGGIGGAMTGWFIASTANTEQKFPAPAPDSTDSMGLGRTFVAEFVFTLMLVSSVLNCAVSKKYGHAGNHFYGLAIGMSVLTGAFCVGNVSGAAFNPAVTISLQVVQCMARSDPPPGQTRCSSLQWIWLYLIAQFLASYIAAFVFSIVSCEDHNEDGSPPGEYTRLDADITPAQVLNS